MRDLIGFLYVWVILFLGSIFLDAPDWAPVLFAGLLVVTFLVYVIAYGYFARKDPSALRSEKYALQHYEMRHGILGDSEFGEVDNPQREVKDNRELVIQPPDHTLPGETEA